MVIIIMVLFVTYRVHDCSAYLYVSIEQLRRTRSIYIIAKFKASRASILVQSIVRINGHPSKHHSISESDISASAVNNIICLLRIPTLYTSFIYRIFYIIRLIN